MLTPATTTSNGFGASVSLSSRKRARYACSSASAVSHGFCAITMIPTPMRAISSIDWGETADANVRPLNVESGRGRIGTRGCWYSSPSYSM